jgi:large subunit ribosomal protein L13
MKTYATKASDLKPTWHLFDASEKILGRLSTEIAYLLQGKHKPIYSRHLLSGDYVVVVNAEQIRVTGNNKETQKIYYSHSQYPSGLRETPLSRMRQRHPDRIIRLAVRGMLPKTTLGRQMLKRLKVYAGDSHPHGAQINSPTRS